MFATLMAATGNGISLVALPWLVLQRHDSAWDASIVAAAAMLPLLFSTLIAGMAVDYFGSRRVSLFSDFISGASLAGVPLVAFLFGGNAVNVGVLAVLAAAAAAFNPAGMSARASMLPEAAARACWSLDRTNSGYMAIFYLANIVGAGVGGFMITAVGSITTMWIAAAGFGASTLAIAALRLEGVGKPHHETRPAGLMSGMTEGLRFVWNARVLRTLALVRLSVVALYLPMEKVLFPKYFADLHRPAQLGWVLMALCAGGLVGSLGYGVLSQHLCRRATVLAAVIALGATTAAFGLMPPLPATLLLGVVAGLVYGPMQPVYLIVSQTWAPQHLRGRVIGVMTSATYAAAPFGLLLAGVLAEGVGLRMTFVALAVPMVVIGLVAVFLPALYELNRTFEHNLGQPRQVHLRARYR